MKVNASELLQKIVFEDQERFMRRILFEECNVSYADLAMMTRRQVCEDFLKSYEVVHFSDDDGITVVRKEDMSTYKSIVKTLF